MLTMSGDSAYTGATTVSDGHLEVTGSLASVVTTTGSGTVSAYRDDHSTESRCLREPIHFGRFHDRAESPGRVGPDSYYLGRRHRHQRIGLHRGRHSATVSSGLSGVIVGVAPTDDIAVEQDETVVLTITAGSGYSIETRSDATVTIHDTIRPTRRTGPDDGDYYYGGGEQIPLYPSSTNSRCI